MKHYYDEPIDLPTANNWLHAAIVTLAILCLCAIASEIFK